MSTTRTPAPTLSAMALTAAPPAWKFRTIWAVTSGGNADTPVRAMPWSPAKTTTRARSSPRGGHRPWHAATQQARSSSLPSEPGGLVSWCWRASAARRACTSGGTIAGNVAPAAPDTSVPVISDLVAGGDVRARRPHPAQLRRAHEGVPAEREAAVGDVRVALLHAGVDAAAQEEPLDHHQHHHDEHEQADDRLQARVQEQRQDHDDGQRHEQSHQVPTRIDQVADVAPLRA